MLKHLFCILGVLLWAIPSLAQGTLKGTIIDKKTGEPLPFVNVLVFKDGVQVHGGTTDFDGGFIIKPLDTAGTYDIEVAYVGYYRYRREGVRVKPTGFTLLEIQLPPSPSNLEEIEIVLDNYGSQDGMMLAPLPEYEIVDPGLKALLDRVIKGEEHTYFWKDEPFEAKASPEGTTFNLYLFSQPSIDTTWDSIYDYNYLYMLRLDDPTLPRPLKGEAPTFSFDSTTTCVQVVTTYYPEAFSDGTQGFAAYRGRIFFLQEPIDDERFFRRLKKDHHLFKYGKIPAWGRKDPATWIYTLQQGHWYRWMEFPKGF